MGWPEYKTDLESALFNPEHILDRYFHSGQSVVFADSPEEEPRLKSQIARSLYGALGVECHPLELVICGSAHLGFSPVPHKLGKLFSRETSDIDVAVVSQALFNLWWKKLRRRKFKFGDMERSQIVENVFSGYVDPGVVRENSELGKVWWQLFGKIKPEYAVGGVRGRVYQDFWCMQNYHKRAIKQGREKLQDNLRTGAS